jgi:hypothetical protein
MAWAKLITTTLGSAAASFDMSTVPDNKFIMLLGHVLRNGAVTWTQPGWYVGNGSVDTGANYSQRYSQDGGADTASGGHSSVNWWANGADPKSDVFSVTYLFNISGEEKLFINFAVDNNRAGSNAPRRQEMYAKWANTSNVIDEIRCHDFGGGSGMNTGSNITSIGTN